MKNDTLSETRKKSKSQTSSEILGKNIQKKRMEKDISQEYLAEMLDISRQSISKWENGLSAPSTKNLAQLSVIFQCDIAELLSEDIPGGRTTSFMVIGIAVDARDISKVRDFFQEFPSDVLECYDTSVVIVCNGGEEDLWELEQIVENTTGLTVEAANREALLHLKGSKIHLISKKDYGESINDFFEQLVHLYQENTVAVLMAEEPSDGLNGIRQVKKSGGLVVLCEVEENEKSYRNFMSDGLYSYVLKPMYMGYWISKFVRKAYFEKEENYRGILTERFSSRVSKCLEKTSSYSISDFKEEYIIKSFIERIDKNSLSSAEQYIRLLENSANEQAVLMETILKKSAGRKLDSSRLVEIKELFKEIRPDKTGIRIWIIGCGRGIEAYTIAMLLADYMERHKWNSSIKIFATATEEREIAEAIDGRFTYEEIERLPKKWIDKYFRFQEGEYYVIQNIRNMIIFSVHDILHTPPFARIDLIVCRNVIEKYRIKSKTTIISRIAYSLNKGGYLVLESDRCKNELQKCFKCLSKFEGRVWKKQRNDLQAMELSIAGEETFSISNVVCEMLTLGIPACVIMDERYDILYIGKGASKYMNFKAGNFSKCFFDHADIRVGVLVSTALKYLHEDNEWQEIMTLKRDDAMESEVVIHINEKTIRNRIYYLVWFEETNETIKEEQLNAGFEKREKRLERELEISNERLYQALREVEETKDKYGIINEKLQSSNEELILMNDELQMVNQELVAANRKLTRVNAEYQEMIEKLPDFSKYEIDFFQLLGLNIIFLDQKMVIKKVSENIQEITNIKKEDLGKDIRKINLINGYLGWTDDLNTVAEGENVYRVINGKGHSRLIIEIFQHFFLNQKQMGYIIVIQKIEKGGK